MDPARKTLDLDTKIKILPFPNGAVKKHHLPKPLPAADLLYRECLKNHAASLGGHAVDGCGEFMPSPAANPADPTSLKCAACGCHRNFHRRLTDPHHQIDGQDESGEEMDGQDEDDEDRGDDGRNRSSSSPPPYFSSAPHMLLALSAGISGGPTASGSGAGPTPAGRPSTPPPGPSGEAAAAVGVLPRKRFRTKFSGEQKGRMQELSEKLGWRMQKRDEGLVEEWCREIGVGKGVFKVWMHNNKHNYLGGRRGEGGTGSGGGGGIEEGNGGGGGGGNSSPHVMNGSSSSS